MYQLNHTWQGTKIVSTVTYPTYSKAYYAASKLLKNYKRLGISESVKVVKLSESDINWLQLAAR